MAPLELHPSGQQLPEVRVLPRNPQRRAHLVHRGLDHGAADADVLPQPFHQLRVRRLARRQGVADRAAQPVQRWRNPRRAPCPPAPCAAAARRRWRRAAASDAAAPPPATGLRSSMASRAGTSRSHRRVRGDHFQCPAAAGVVAAVEGGDRTDQQLPCRQRAAPRDLGQLDLLVGHRAGGHRLERPPDRRRPRAQLVPLRQRLARWPARAGPPTRGAGPTRSPRAARAAGPAWPAAPPGRRSARPRPPSGVPAPRASPYEPGSARSPG